MPQSSTANDIAIFLDLDNVMIAASEARLSFDINIVLEHIRQLTGGRIVLRRAYGDWRQNQETPRQIAAAGFEIQSAVRLNSMSKNLADMQLIVDAVETLLEGYSFKTYVLVTGDRDFMPLVQVLRKRGKYVIGVGVRHATSGSLAELCDDYVYYDELTEVERKLTKTELRKWLEQATSQLWQDQDRIRASVLRKQLDIVSDGVFASSQQAKGSFSKLLEQYDDLLALERDGTTVYVVRPKLTTEELHLSYRTALKRHGLRVVPATTRLRVLKDTIAYLQFAKQARWHQVVEYLSEFYAAAENPVSKSQINDVLRVARRAQVISVPTDGNKPLSSLPVTLKLAGDNIFKQAVMQCDTAYLHQIREFADLPFDLSEATIALYDGSRQLSYIKYIDAQPSKALDSAPESENS